tara:strand:- start:468 stop:953 length:486 start_codon:yes stop_codon:yes gene_type:complete
MKVLNCANCGGDLNYKFDSPVAVCQYCDSVNVFDNFNIKIDPSNLVDGSPEFIEDLQPRIMLPEEKFIANYVESTFNNQGGKLWVSNKEIFFKPHIINFGDLSKKFMKIQDIVTMEMKWTIFNPASFNLLITDKSGNCMDIISWNRKGIITAIEKRKKNLV